MNCAFVVRGVASLDEGENERLSDCAAGLVWDVRNASEGLSSAVAGESKVLRWVTRVALRVCVERSARFSLRVSWSLRRSRRIDSGVGAEEEMGNCISYSDDQQRSSAWKGFRLECKQLAYFVMRQPHPRRQIIRNCQDIP